MLFRSDGESMMSTLHNGDRVLVNRLSYRLHDPRRGDVVVLKRFDGASAERDLIKRVIGLPGDKVAIYNGKVVINSHAVSEPYLLEPPVGNYAEQTVPEGAVFVLGDNRNHSEDSRSWGFLEIDKIVVKAVFRYWPFDMVGIVQHPTLVLATP